MRERERERERDMREMGQKGQEMNLLAVSIFLTSHL